MISPGMSSCEHSLNTLRYADRVKELAATDPTEMKVSPTDDERELKIEEQSNNSVLSDSDLAQLRSLNVRQKIEFPRQLGLPSFETDRFFHLLGRLSFFFFFNRRVRFHKTFTRSTKRYLRCKCWRRKS